MPVTPRTTQNGGVKGFFQNEFLAKLFVTLLFILLVYVIVLFATMIRNNIAEYGSIGRAERAERLISFSAEGKVTVAPDTAVISLGMLADGKTVAEAQEKNTAVMNRLIERLQMIGVAKEDIQTTNYSVYPKYNYTEIKGQALDGYEVSQNVTVKIREVEKAQDILALVGEVGANSVSGLSFVIDDPENYRAKARELAIEKVMKKAHNVANALGVALVDIAAYDEYEGGSDFPGPYYAEKSVGGAPAEPPTVMSGSQEVVMNVTVTFEIRSRE